MDVLDIIRCLIRRWYITLPAMVVVAAGVWGSYQRTPPTRSTSAVLLFVGPRVDVRFDGTSEVVVPQNPLVNVAGTQIAALVTSQSLAGDDVRSRLQRAGLDVDYDAVVDNRNPIVAISADSTVPGDAVAGIQLLVDAAREQLITRQDEVGAPAQSRLDVQVLRMSRTESVSNMPKIRNAMVVAVVGSGFTTAAAAAAEGIARWRRGQARRAESVPVHGVRVEEVLGSGDMVVKRSPAADWADRAQDPSSPEVPTDADPNDVVDHVHAPAGRR